MRWFPDPGEQRSGTGFLRDDDDEISSDEKEHCKTTGKNGLLTLLRQGRKKASADRPIVAARFGKRWVPYDEIMSRDDKRSGLHFVPFHVNLERVALEILNRVHGHNETGLAAIAPNQRAKIFWDDGFAAGFYTYLLVGDNFGIGVEDGLTDKVSVPKLVGIYVLPSRRKKGMGAKMVDDFLAMPTVVGSRFVAVEMPITEACMRLLALRVPQADYKRMVGFEGAYCRGNLRDLLDEAAGSATASADGDAEGGERRAKRPRRKATLVPEPRL